MSQDQLEARLRALADPTGFLINLFVHAPVGFAVWNRDGSPLLTNPAFRALFGAEPPPEYRVLEDNLLREHGLLPLLERAFAGETVQLPMFWFDPRQLTSVAVAEGKRVAISVTLFPLRDERGELQYVGATYKDETELRTLTEQLMNSEERLRLAGQAARIGIFEWNLVTGARVWSAELEAIYGLAPGTHATMTEPELSLIHPDDRATASALVDEALRSYGPVEGEWRVVWRDGSVRTVFARFQAFRGADGTPTVMMGVNLDITERRRADAARREAEAQSRAVMQAALDAIVVMDHAGAIVDFNPAAERLFGYTRAEVLGRSLGDTLIPPRLRDGHAHGLARYLATAKPHVLGRRVELSGIHRDGREFPAEVAVVRIDSEGEPMFTGYIRDITERKRAAESEILVRAKEAAEAANVELEAFSYSVAHDLRAPLRAMSGFAAVLREDYGDKLDADAHAVIARISMAAKRMGELIDGLLALSRISTHELEYATVDLGKLARDVLANLPVKIDARIEDDLRVRADPVLMRSVIQNLVNNAIKFSARVPTPRIEVGMMTTDVGPTYFVRDNGAGFDMAYAAQLFRPFKRLHTSSEFEGTGIGLATVQRVIRRHGGTIWAQAAPGSGATFFFTL
jgi:PAS domain S-box-containing protein